MKETVYLGDFGVVCSLGSGKRAVWDAVSRASTEGITRAVVSGKDFWLGVVPPELYQMSLPDPFNSRTNAILRVALDEIAPSVHVAVSRYGAARVGVIIGSCDNGSERSLAALSAYRANGAFPAGYSLECQRADLPSRFAANHLGLSGPAFACSTACASSASALVSARNLILSGVCDAVVAGGVDIVSPAVALGFASLEAVSDEPCRPFSGNRKGITLGEAAAVFLMTRDDISPSSLRLLGAGESADAHHMTAPDPEGKGAALAMERSLADSGLSAGDIDYVNLHGTGTALNDAMESRALSRIFPSGVPASSTKSLTGHTLGAAGSLELGICWLALSPDFNPGRSIPPQTWDGHPDPELPEIDIVKERRTSSRLSACMSNSFAFGGCNVSLVIG